MCASVPSGADSTAKARKNAIEDHQRQRRHRALEVLLARDERAGAGERAGVERVADARTTPARGAAAPRTVPSTSSAPVAAAVPSPIAPISSRLPSPSSPSPITLPASRCAGRIVDSTTSTTREAFSSTTPGGDPVAVRQQLAVEDQHDEERQAGLGVLVRIDRLERGQLQRLRVEDPLRPALRHAGLLERPRRADLAVGGLQERERARRRGSSLATILAADDRGVERAVVDLGADVAARSPAAPRSARRSPRPRSRPRRRRRTRPGRRSRRRRSCSPPPMTVDSTITSDDDHDVDPRRDEERLLAHALADLALRDERDRLAPLHAATASRNRSVSVGRSRLK